MFSMSSSGVPWLGRACGHGAAWSGHTPLNVFDSDSCLPGLPRRGFWIPSIRLCCPWLVSDVGSTALGPCLGFCPSPGHCWCAFWVPKSLLPTALLSLTRVLQLWVPASDSVPHQGVPDLSSGSQSLRLFYPHAALSLMKVLQLFQGSFLKALMGLYVVLKIWTGVDHMTGKCLASGLSLVYYVSKYIVK